VGVAREGLVGKIFSGRYASDFSVTDLGTFTHVMGISRGFNEHMAAVYRSEISGSPAQGAPGLELRVPAVPAPGLAAEPNTEFRVVMRTSSLSAEPRLELLLETENGEKKKGVSGDRPLSLK